MLFKHTTKAYVCQSFPVEFEYELCDFLPLCSLIDFAVALVAKV